MKDLIEVLSVVMLAISILFLVTVLLLNLYLKIRRKFPVRVNCWFCNQWTKVPYDSLNSFECPTCLQYNGFSNDGDYNRVIPEQHNQSLNQRSFTVQNVTTTACNRLCNYCNNNQELKIYQLANFVPLNEENFDVEIEHFQKQLENAYKLCKKCENTLKTTILHQNAWLVGKKLVMIRDKGFNAFDFDKGVTKQVFVDVVRYCLVLISTIIVVNTLFELKTANITISKQFQPYKLLLKDLYMFWANTLESLLMNIYGAELLKEVVWTFITTFKKIRFLEYLRNDVLSIVGVFLQVIFMLIYNNRFKWLQLTTWLILNAAIYPVHSKHVLFNISLKIFTSVFIVLSSLNTTKSKKIITKRKVLKKQMEYCLDNSDGELLNDKTVNKSIMENGHVSACSNNRTQIASVLNCSPTETLLDDANQNPDIDFNKSFNNMRLSNFDISNQINKNPFVLNSSINRSKPILWPSKLEGYTQNSWVAGGFWHNSGFLSPPLHYSNLSRSSSQSSGFLSQGSDRLVFNSLPVSRNNSISGDFERASILSEPPSYHFNTIEQRPHKSHPTTHSFLNTNQMLYFYSNCPKSNVHAYSTTRFKPNLCKQTSSSLFKPYLRKLESMPTNWAERMGTQKLDSFGDLYSSISEKLNLS